MLAAYYLVRSAWKLQFLPATLIPSPFIATLFDTACDWLTNFLLFRSLLPLQIGLDMMGSSSAEPAIGTDAGWLQRWIWKSITPLFLVEAVAFTWAQTWRYGSFTAAIAGSVMPPGESEKWYVGILSQLSIVPHRLVAGLIFLWCSKLYFIRPSASIRVLGVAIAGYGFLQWFELFDICWSAMGAPLVGPEHMDWLYAAAKLLLIVPYWVSGAEMLRSPEVKSPDIAEWKARFRTFVSLQRQLLLPRVVGRLQSNVAGVFLITLLCSQAYSPTLLSLRDPSWLALPPATAAFLAGASCIVLILILSSIWVVHGTPKLVASGANWSRVARSHFRDCLVHELRAGSQSVPGQLSIETLRLAESIPTSGRPPKLDVVLLHGIFSSGREAWGALPLTFLHSEQVVQVHIVSYPHNLFSSRKRLLATVAKFTASLEEICRSSDRQIVVFAHSLGGLIAIRSLADVFDANLAKAPECREKIRHLACIAPPLGGSWFGFLGFFFAWLKALRPGSSFVLETIDKYYTTFLHPGRQDPAADNRCTVSFMFGMDDYVIANLHKLVDAGAIVALPTSHSTEVYELEGALADTFLAELTRCSRACERARLVGFGLGLGRHPDKLVLAELRLDAHGLIDLEASEIEEYDHATSVYTLEPYPRRRWRADEPRLLRKELESLHASHSAAMGRSSLSSDEFNVLWMRLKSAVARAALKSELARVDWPGDKTLYVVRFRNSAAFVLLDERYLKSLRTQ